MTLSRRPPATGGASVAGAAVAAVVGPAVAGPAVGAVVAPPFPEQATSSSDSEPTIAASLRLGVDMPVPPHVTRLAKRRRPLPARVVRRVPPSPDGGNRFAGARDRLSVPRNVNDARKSERDRARWWPRDRR